MCYMCDKLGDGDYWYYNPKLFARQMYNLKAPEQAAKVYGQTELSASVPASTSAPRAPSQAELRRIMCDEPEKHPEALKIFNAELRTRENAVGQAITLQEACRMADIGAPMASMGCMCRWQHRAYEERSQEEFSCLGTGVGMFKWERWPERYKGGVHFMPPEEVKEWLRKWNKRGFMHLIMALPGGYIEGICNCEYPACISIRNRLDMGIETLLKGHFVARVDYNACNGCGICVQRCQFGAAKYEVRIDKSNIDHMRCFGCGLCETGCPRGAITMIDKAGLPGMKEVW